MGLVLSIITPLGDLGESMIKRQVGMKDSGNSAPGARRRFRPHQLLAVGRGDRLLPGIVAVYLSPL